MPVTADLSYRMLTTDWITYRAKRTPHALALQVGEMRWTYDHLDLRAELFARRLAGAGVNPGDRVGTLLNTRADYAFLVHALTRVGAVLVPFNTRLTVPELQWQQSLTQCKIIVCDAAHETAASQLDAPLYSVDGPSLTDTHAFAELSPTPELFVPLPAERVQAIVFTSGTSGYPKGVEVTFNNHYYSATASAMRLGLDKSERWLSSLPLYHIGGLSVLFRSCLYGTAVVLEPKFSIESYAQHLRENDITLTSLVPTMLYRLLAEHPQLEAPALRHLLLGGAAASPELVAQCLDANIPIATTYGLTEATSQVATMVWDDVQKFPGSVGCPLMFTNIRILDRSGGRLNSVRRNEVGEIAVSGPTVMQGYFKNPAATEQTLIHGELMTGDMGYIDSYDNLWVVQRRSDIIISGGENIYPAEIERVLLEHPCVEQVCVTGLEDAEWGQKVGALIVQTSDSPLSTDDLERWGRQRLAGYKQPRVIKFTDALPLTGSGKIQRKAVLAELNG